VFLSFGIESGRKSLILKRLPDYPSFLWITLLIAGLTGTQSLKNQGFA
jgi:hypothetical protein